MESPRLRLFPLVSNDYLSRETGKDTGLKDTKETHPQGVWVLQTTSCAVTHDDYNQIVLCNLVDMLHLFTITKLDRGIKTGIYSL